jgi:hypothetical protein
MFCAVFYVQRDIFEPEELTKILMDIWCLKKQGTEPPVKKDNQEFETEKFLLTKTPKS